MGVRREMIPTMSSIESLPTQPDTDADDGFFSPSEFDDEMQGPDAGGADTPTPATSSSNPYATFEQGMGMEQFMMGAFDFSSDGEPSGSEREKSARRDASRRKSSTTSRASTSTAIDEQD